MRGGFKKKVTLAYTESPEPPPTPHFWQELPQLGLDTYYAWQSDLLWSFSLQGAPSGDLADIPHPPRSPPVGAALRVVHSWYSEPS